MSLLHVRQIEGRIKSLFEHKIDLSDVAECEIEQRSTTFLTRGLAAFTLVSLADLDADAAALAITDGSGDNGIDAVHYDRNEGLLYVLQAKWHKDGHGAIERGDLQKFIQGFKDLINARFERFNVKFQIHTSAIDEALMAGNTRVALVLVHTGQEDLAAEQHRDIEDLVDEMNDPSDLVTPRIIQQEHLHGFVAKGVRGAPINLEVALKEWGQVREPHESIYGQVAAVDVGACQYP